MKELFRILYKEKMEKKMIKWTFEDAKKDFEVVVMNAMFGNIQEIETSENEPSVYVLSKEQFRILSSKYLEGKDKGITKDE